MEPIYKDQTVELLMYSNFAEKKNGTWDHGLCRPEYPNSKSFHCLGQESVAAIDRQVPLYCNTH